MLFLVPFPIMNVKPLCLLSLFIALIGLLGSSCGTIESDPDSVRFFPKTLYKKSPIQKVMSTNIDSDMTRQQALNGSPAPLEILDQQVLITVIYWGFDSKPHRGQLVMHHDLVEDVQTIFEDLYAMHFPIEKVIPIVVYGWDDDASMADNNSSGFNYRFINHTKTLSNHAFGMAVDINPRINPYFTRYGTYPTNGNYNPIRPGTFVRHGPAVEVFTSRGWIWGGNFQSNKDYQHFEKSIR